MVATLKRREPVKDPQKVFHYTDLQRTKPTRENDPYEYQPGWGNRHQSEVIPGTLPIGQNNPQDRGFGLYTEGITYSSFAAPRGLNMSTYMYRARPSAAHQGYSRIETKSHIENCFLSLNPKVEPLYQQAEWSPFPLPREDETIDFTDGLHTLGGSGDPNLRQGIAVYVYMINSSMINKAYCNTDGDFLITPQLGIIDIQTEMGRLFVQPGEICVIQRGVRFRINLAEGVPVARGHIAEVWGSMWELPDLGPIGGHGLANPRDFLYPVAHIDEDLHVPFKIVVKNNGKHVVISQDHSPFDVVAWHGNCVPYKYDLTKFVAQNSTSVDHTDPSINTVLTAKSVDPHVPLADYLWFGPRATEMLACIYGAGLGRSDDFLPGGCSYEGGHTPHGGFGEEYITEAILQHNEPRRILENQMTIMVESSRTFLFTEYAREICGVLHKQGTDYRVWDKLPDRFSAHRLTKKLLERAAQDKANQKKAFDYYHSIDLLDAKGHPTTSLPQETNGHAVTANGA
ncbi:homogentisate 1 2-dioxygenase [Fusarium beomiforme]|uniref:homogentisate 1,2-dioxygenase n=1 Tax=Fusarium beomiforme TaxID=44412 RepID=A0A9P5ACQ4_9HYPO|nr:homogentisate 1 2-dioxygenase [Fusarium beomiforme]